MGFILGNVYSSVLKWLNQKKPEIVRLKRRLDKHCRSRSAALLFVWRISQPLNSFFPPKNTSLLSFSNNTTYVLDFTCFVVWDASRSPAKTQISFHQLISLPLCFTYPLAVFNSLDWDCFSLCCEQQLQQDFLTLYVVFGSGTHGSFPFVFCSTTAANIHMKYFKKMSCSRNKPPNTHSHTPH